MIGCGAGIDWRYESYGLRVDYMLYEPEINGRRITNLMPGIYVSIQPEYVSIGAEGMFSFVRRRNYLILGGSGVGARISSLSTPDLFFQSRGIDITPGIEFQPYWTKLRNGTYFALFFRPYILFNISTEGLDINPSIAGGFHLYIPSDVIEKVRP